MNIINKNSLYNCIDLVLKNSFHRDVKSFVIRRKKISEFQYNIINRYWKKFCINFIYLRKIKHFFLNKNPIIIDIGFGDGKKILYDAIQNYRVNFLGIEVFLKGILYCLNRCYINNIKNFKIICYDAFYVFKYMLLDNSIFKIQIFFPDPWKKRKHNKRRLINLMFLSLIKMKLQKNGILHIITDCRSYYKNIVKNISIIKCFKKFFFIEMTTKRCKKTFFNCNTKYEIKAKNKKKFIYNMIYIKN
ncbi:tRNA (guanosine(46)-N7)-methyltransferase TrmB [Buchnera aphidicola (Chaitoregma tattakana)]|uniref:tRNA (guanosine(46)-N7)-methyltransferase TrmB n=1 Tax=Buchnera aphidicola TaxID=9 RepID=UPI0031B8197B